MRPKTTIYLACSLDGFIADEAGGVDWLEPFHDPDGTDDFGFGALMASVDALLMGRNTWDVVQQFSPWPYAGTPVYVRTRRPLPAKNGEIAVTGDIEDVLADLARRGHRHVYIDGGITAQDALSAGVVDEVTITTIPMVLGRGVVLFRRGWGPHRWTLLRTHSNLRAGMTQATYTPHPPE